MTTDNHMTTDNEVLAKLLLVAQEQLRWQKVAVLPLVKATVTAALTTSAMRRAYELADGSLAGAEIAKSVGTSPQSLSRWAMKWRDLGIAHETAGRRIVHLVSLESLGVSLEVDE